MTFHEALRVIALRDVLLSTPEFQARWIQRWFSRTFHTPLPVVEELPEEQLYQAFYESQYEIMVDSEEFADDLAKEKRDLMEDPTERRERVKREEQQAVDDVEFAKQREVALEQEQKQREIKRQRQLEKLMEQDSIEGAPKVLPPQRYTPVREPKLPQGIDPRTRMPQAPSGGNQKPVPIPAGFQMNFISPEQMAKLMEESAEGDNLPPETLPKPKK